MTPALTLLGWADITQLLNQVVHARPQPDTLPLYVPTESVARVREVQAALNESLVQMPSLEPVRLADQFPEVGEMVEGSDEHTTDEKVAELWRTFAGTNEVLRIERRNFKHVLGAILKGIALRPAAQPASATAVEPICPACNGSGEGAVISGGGPDAYDVACVCQTCNGHGLVGGYMADGSGYGEGCPDCNPETAAQPVGEPFGWWFTEDPDVFCMPGSGFRRFPDKPQHTVECIALYTTPQPSPSTAREFVEWMKSQPEDREPTTIDGALAEFEAQQPAHPHQVTPNPQVHRRR